MKALRFLPLFCLAVAALSVGAPAQAAFDTCALADANPSATVMIDSTTFPYTEFVDLELFNADYDPINGCTGYIAEGYDGVIKIVGGATDTLLRLTWDNQTEDGSTYLFTDCADYNSCVGGADEFVSSAESFTACIEAGMTYYWILDCYDLGFGGEGEATIEYLGTCVSSGADDCDEADTNPDYTVDITTELPYSAYVNTALFADDYDASSCQDMNFPLIGQAPDAVFRIHNPDSYTRVVFLDWDSNNDQRLGLFFLNSCSDPCLGFLDVPPVRLRIDAGESIYYVVDGIDPGSTSEGLIEITDGGVELPDTCDDTLTNSYWTLDVNMALPFTQYALVFGQNNDYSAESCGSDFVGRGQDGVIRLENLGTADRFVTVDWSGSAGDRDGIVFEDCAGACLDYSDSGPLSFCVPAGETRFFVVDAYGIDEASEGFITIIENGPCPVVAPDTCAAADADTAFHIDVAVALPYSNNFETSTNANDYSAAGCGDNFVGRGRDGVLRIENSGTTSRVVEFDWFNSTGDRDGLLFSDCSSGCLAYEDGSPLVYCIEPGEVYYFVIDSYGDDSVSVGEVNITDLGECPETGPDTCSDAFNDPNWLVEVGSGLPFTAGISTLGLMNDYNATTCGSASVGLGPDAVVAITNDQDFAVAVQVTWTTDTGNGDVVIFKDDCSGSCVAFSATSPLTVCLEPMTNYFIVVDSANAGLAFSGNLTITGQGACPPDTCDQALQDGNYIFDLASIANLNFTFDTSALTHDYSSEIGGCAAASPGKDGVVVIQNSGSSAISFTARWQFNANITEALYLVDGCDLSSTCLVGNIASAAAAEITYCVEAGAEYFLVLDSAFSTSFGPGRVWLSTAGVCGGDECATALPASCGAGALTGNRATFTNQIDATTYGAFAIGNGEGNEVWYNLGEISASTRFSARVTGSADLYLLTSSTGDCGALSVVASGDVNLTYTFNSATTAFLVVDGDSGLTPGLFTVTTSCVSFFDGFVVGDTQCSTAAISEYVPTNQYYDYGVAQFCVPAADIQGAGVSGTGLFQVNQIGFLLCEGEIDPSYHNLTFYLNQRNTCPDYTQVVSNFGTMVAGNVQISGSSPTWVTVTLSTPYLLGDGNVLIVSSCDSEEGWDSNDFGFAANSTLYPSGLFMLQDFFEPACGPVSLVSGDEEEEYSWCTIGLKGDFVTPTPTPIVTDTPVPTNTNTSVATATPTNTVAPTSTPTSTATGSTPTATSTATATSGTPNTPTPTHTPTPTGGTPTTSSPTPTASQTPTPSPTISATPADTNTPTFTPTPTATNTPSAPDVELGLRVSFNPSGSRVHLVEMTTANNDNVAYPVALYVAVEVFGTFYFYPAFTEAVAPLASFDLPASFYLDYFTLIEIPFPDPLGVQVQVTWYAAFISTTNGSLIGPLASDGTTLE